MTAAHIREKTWTSQIDVLAEIAAQLAELNEKAEKSGIVVTLCASTDDIPVRIRQ